MLYGTYLINLAHPNLERESLGRHRFSMRAGGVGEHAVGSVARPGRWTQHDQEPRSGCAEPHWQTAPRSRPGKPRNDNLKRLGTVPYLLIDCSVGGQGFGGGLCLLKGKRHDIHQIASPGPNRRSDFDFFELFWRQSNFHSAPRCVNGKRFRTNFLPWNRCH